MENPLRSYNTAYLFKFNHPRADKT